MNYGSFLAWLCWRKWPCYEIIDCTRGRRSLLGFCVCTYPMRDGVNIVISSLIGWAHAQNYPCCILRYAPYLSKNACISRTRPTWGNLFDTTLSWLLRRAWIPLLPAGSHSRNIWDSLRANIGPELWGGSDHGSASCNLYILVFQCIQWPRCRSAWHLENKMVNIKTRSI